MMILLYILLAVLVGILYMLFMIAKMLDLLNSNTIAASKNQYQALDRIGSIMRENQKRN